jgi:ATP-dependent Lon protease
MKAIQKELGGREQAAEAEEFRKKIDDANMLEEAEKQTGELERLSRLPSAALSTA